MSHANEINETQFDDHKCSVTDFDTANEIATGKIYMRIFVYINVPLSPLISLIFLSRFETLQNLTICARLIDWIFIYCLVQSIDMPELIKFAKINNC